MSSSFMVNEPTARIVRLLGAACLSSAFVLVGCGQKGDLYLPAGDASAEGQQMIESGNYPQDDAFDRVDDDTMAALPEPSADPNDY